MKRYLNIFSFVGFLIFVIWRISIVIDGDRHVASNQEKPSRISKTEQIWIAESNELVPSRAVGRLLRKSNKRDSVVFYSSEQAPQFTASAQGVDMKHHIVNSYLEGFSPFYTDNIWIPLYTLAKKKQYQYDHFTYRGKQEVWQSSKQAFRYTRGDCEDHAIALADWLIDMGEDARVVLGRYKNGGHAWVVLFKEGKEFLLEATQKTGLKKLRQYPLAKHKVYYYPQYMFNRSRFWKNTGSLITANYSSPQWVYKSEYGL